MASQAWSSRPGRSSKWITRTRRLAIYIRDGFTCQYCGRDLRNAEPREVTLDHLQPQCRNGGHGSSNLVTACGRCNYGRQDRTWWSYAPAGARVRIMKARRRTPNLKLARAILRGEVSRMEALAQITRCA